MSSSELGFLIDLMLNHKLPITTKRLVAERIKYVEELLSTRGPGAVSPAPRPNNIGVSVQAASTQALIAKHADLNPGLPIAIAPPVEQVAQVAQTQAAATAMASRQAAINASISGSINKETGRPRKF